MLSFVPLVLALLCFPVFAQTNPFLSGGNQPADNAEVETQQPHGPAVWPVIGELLARSSAAQRNLQQTIASAISEVNDSGNIKTLGTLLGISFVFGILHAAGPGHRKAVIAAYFIGEKANPLKGIATGFLLALAHAASAVFLVGGIYLFTANSLLLSVDRAQNLMLPITWGIIFLLGIWMIVRSIIDFRRGRDNGQKTVKTGLGGLILSGLVPCPAASAIMILAVAGKALPIGILSVLAMSLGMGILLASIGLLSILMRTRMTAFLKDSSRGHRLESGLELFSGIAMVLFGLFMMIGSL